MYNKLSCTGKLSHNIEASNHTTENRKKPEKKNAKPEYFRHEVGIHTFQLLWT